MALLRNFPALAERGVRRYVLGQAVSTLGFWVQAITLNLLLWDGTHSPVALGLLNFLLYGPMLVVAPLFGGRLKPQHSRDTVLRILACTLTVSAALLVASIAGLLTPAVILGAALVLGVLSAMETPARQLMLTSSLEDRSKLSNAVAMNTVVFNVGRMAGPAVAAIVYSHAGPTVAIACSFVGILTMRLCVRGITTHRIEVKAAGGMRGALQFARGDEFARRYLPVITCMGLFVGTYQTLIPVLAAQQFGNAAAYTGLFFSCAGAGSFAAALLLSSRFALGPSALPKAPWISVAALAGVALSLWPAMAVPCFVVIGFTLTFVATSVSATLQHRAGDEVRGGVVGLYSMAFMGAMPIGHLMVGLLSSAIGPRHSFGVMACLMSLALVVQRLLQGPSSISNPRRSS